MNKIWIHIVLLLSGLSGLAQDFSIQKAEVNTPANDFAIQEIDGQRYFCSDRRTQSLITVQDESGQLPVHWFDEEGEVSIPDGYASPASHHLGPFDVDHLRNEIACTVNISAEGQKTEVLGIQFIGKGQKQSQHQYFPWNSTNAGYNTAHPTFSLTGDTLVFCSDKAGGKGGADLYYSVRGNGEWSQPELIDRLNTPGNEYFPVFAPNGWLYFSSDSLPGAEMLDIYFSYPEQGAWSKPQRLKAPINSKGNDYHMVFDQDEIHGFFSTDRKGGDSDIWEFTRELPTFESCKPSFPEPTCYLIEETEITHNDTLPVYYEWDFGDGTTARGLSNEHCFPGVGTYDVALNIFDTITGAQFGRVSELRVQIEMARIPFITGIDSIEVNEPVAFGADLSELGRMELEDLYWNSGDGRKHKGTEWELSYAAPGVYDLSLGAMAMPRNGQTYHQCATRKIVVYDPRSPELLTEKVAFEAVIPEAKRENETTENEDERVYFVEFHQSPIQMTLNDPYFEHVPFEITERFRRMDSLYHYSVGEGEELLDLYQVRETMIESGYHDVLVKDELPTNFEESTVKRGKYYSDEEKIEMNRYVGTLADIQFAVNSAEIQDASLENLEFVAQLLKEDEGLHLQVDAHTDNSGSEEYNLKLSEERAAAVVAYLTEQGIAESRIFSAGYGNKRPVASNATERGRQQNRRVEFRLIFQEE
ncbi:OmpA family protein [Sanyastnella coralliicola]|uniref:OmpA family protein n=1 Tax=Sanyastnella coralliicola TaxID=3069118 RepID=UPI0027BAF5CA|nr:OmpA family protein [Longitalea sp. SCSIO 12813]